MANPTVDLGWEYVYGDVSIASSAAGTCEIYPPAGKKFVGGGYAVGYAGGDAPLVVYYNRPTPGGDAWQVSVYNTSTGGIVLYAYGIAIYA